MMGRTITLDVPEPLFLRVSSVAGERGLTPADWIVDQLAEQLERPPGKREVVVPFGIEKVSPSEAEDRLVRMFGSFDSGDPDSCNNERIDADLAREYGRGLGEQD